MDFDESYESSEDETLSLPTKKGAKPEAKSAKKKQISESDSDDDSGTRKKAEKET